MSTGRSLRRRLVFAVTGVLFLAGIGLAIPPLRRLFHPVIVRITGRATVDDRIKQYGFAARARMMPDFVAAGVTYPPDHVVLVGLKQEKQLHIYAGSSADDLRYIRSYPVLAASGDLGPKLREGDRQVPEGIYYIESLNPNSRYHLSLRVSYPNDFDRRIAAYEGRTNLGGDIFIHGKDLSIGCLAMGDEAAEDLFILVAETGVANTDVLLSPVDLRTTPLPPELDIDWRAELYEQINHRLAELPIPES